MIHTLDEDTKRRRIGALRSIDAPLLVVRVEDICAEAHEAREIATGVARAAVPILGDAVFFDACERGELTRRIGAAHSSEHPALRTALEAHATSTAWHCYVEHVVMTGLPMIDPSSAALLGVGTTAMGFVVVPLVSRGKILGVMGAVRVHGAYSRADLVLARQIARRAARAIDAR